MLACSFGAYSQMGTREVTETEARAIALAAAGCKRPEDCVVQGGASGKRWVFTVSYVKGRHPNGEPILMPGGWVGITVNSKGKVIDRMPGA